MPAKCPKCNGRGKIRKEKTTCPTCFGVGKTSFALGGKGEGESCQKCKGTGKISTYETCPICEGKKQITYCKQCKKIMNRESKSGLCTMCESQEDPVVYVLKPPYNSRLVRKGMRLLSRVDSVKKVGVFLKLTDKMNVLVRPADMSQDYTWDTGEEVIVEITTISDKQKLYGKPISLESYMVESLRGKVRTRSIEEIMKGRVGTFLSFKAQVVSILQTSGPTRFTFADPSGSIIGAAFIKAGERAFPEITEDMVVQVFGEITQFKESVQIEISDLEELDAKESKEFLTEIEKALDAKSMPPKIDYSVQSKLLTELRPEMEKAAKRIRKAVYTGQPIYIRHHADADGVVAGFSVQKAVTSLMEKEGYDPDTIRIRVKRLPNKPPFFEIIDSVKDIEFAMSDQKRFGDKLPLFVCLDFGSSTESLVSYLKLKAIDLEILVIDHHFPDEKIRELVDVHVNPYFVGGGYEICAGMLGYELARMINPEITDSLSHLPAMAGLMDRVEGEELSQYIKMAKNKGFDKKSLMEMGLAVDYELYYLKFTEGSNILGIIFGLDGIPKDWHEKMVSLLGNEAKTLLDTSLQNILPHAETKTLSNDALLVTVDVELFTHRFTFPPPGKITGLVFDHYCQNNEGKAVVTLGEGPDFMILRSQGLKINFPEVVKLMQEKLPGAAVNGGGHEVVGSLKFYEGTREKVLKFFISHLEKLQLAL